MQLILLLAFHTSVRAVWAMYCIFSPNYMWPASHWVRARRHDFVRRSLEAFPARSPLIKWPLKGVRRITDSLAGSTS